MEGLIGSSSAHHIEGFHPRANLSPCKQPDFDVQPHFIKCVDQRSPHHLSGYKRPALACYRLEDITRFRIELPVH